MNKAPIVGVAIALLCPCLAAQGDVFNLGPGLTNLETVTVGDPGNAGEFSGGSLPDSFGPTRLCGSVVYVYNIGKYEVTAAQYCDFLNHKARSDTYGLYSTSMADPVNYQGCSIQRSGVCGNYSYSVAPDWANRPVNCVSFWSACRFANWLHNGQGNGDTETGAYTLTVDGIANNTVVRNAGWRWAVTSEDEWYKAAYYKGGGTNVGYWDYPTRSDIAPSNVGSDYYADPGNHANYDSGSSTIGGPYYRTNVGEFENSASAYGTFDQAGNILEWNEATIWDDNITRGVRGGSFGTPYRELRAWWRTGTIISHTESDNGFRVCQDAPDHILPVVAITSPSGQAVYSTNNAALSLFGTAVDDHLVSSVAWSNDRGGNGTCLGTTMWTATAVPLVEGINVISVAAVDAAGNAGTAVLTVNYDTIPPAVTVTGPTGDPEYSTDAAILGVSGVASDADGVASVSWSNDRGGSGTCAGGTSWSAGSVPLAPGDNVITVTAHDLAGNGAADVVTVSRLPVSVGAARTAPEGSSVFISEAYVSANSLESGAVFVQTPNCTGVKLVTGETLLVGKKVKCSGTIHRTDGEYQITDVTFQEITAGTPPLPVFLNTRAIGGDPTETLTYTQLNTTGLLVRTSGKVTGVITAQKVVYVDDGAAYQDGYGPVLGLRVHVGSGVSTTWNNKKVAVTGISRVAGFTLAIWGCVNGDWYTPGTSVYVPYIDALSVAFL